MKELEHRLAQVTRKSFFRRLMYPQRGLTAMIKLLGDFRSGVELKAIVAYLAYGAYTGDLRWRLVAFVGDTAAKHAVGHANIRDFGRRQLLLHQYGQGSSGTVHQDLVGSPHLHRFRDSSLA